MCSSDQLVNATLVLFAYDEKPTLGAVRSLVRDARQHPDLAIWDQSKDGLITRTRSMAASRFLEQGHGDVLVMVDHDIEWSDGDVAYIVAAARQERAVVAGIYSQRQFGRGVAVRLEPGSPSVTVGMEGIVEAEYVGTGFMAIHRSVLERLTGYLRRNRHGYWPFFAQREVYAGGETEDLSEDYAFCALVKESGKRIYAATKPTLIHHGTWAYRVSDATWTPRPPQNVTLHAVDATRPVDVPDVGRFYIDPEDRFIGATLRQGKPWEPETLALLKRLSRTSRRKSHLELVELGANIGAHTVPASRWYRHVVAVEPLYADRLRDNLALNEVTNVTVVEAAVGDKAGPAHMLRDYSNPGASHLSTYGREVPMQTLSSLLPESETVLKLDIEGAEYIALKAADLSHVTGVIFEYCEDQLARVSNATPAQLLDLLFVEGFSAPRFVGTGALATPETLPRGQAYCNLFVTRPH